LRDIVVSVRTAIKNYDGYVHIPDLSQYMTLDPKQNGKIDVYPANSEEKEGLL
jgi:hypothetical protein